MFGLWTLFFLTRMMGILQKNILESHKHMINPYLQLITPPVNKVWDPRHSQVAIYTVFDEESEFQVKNKQILDPGGKI